MTPWYLACESGGVYVYKFILVGLHKGEFNRIRNIIRHLFSVSLLLKLEWD